jgi:hypothetical protein
VVATNSLEEERLLDLWERANQNGVPDIELLNSRLDNLPKSTGLDPQGADPPPPPHLRVAKAGKNLNEKVTPPSSPLG